MKATAKIKENPPAKDWLLYFILATVLLSQFTILWIIKS